MPAGGFRALEFRTALTMPAGGSGFRVQVCNPVLILHTVGAGNRVQPRAD
jgi:hypothetical protein